LAVLGIDLKFVRILGEEQLTAEVSGGVELLYYGAMNVGGQVFNADFDTGSSDTFVPGPNCAGCAGNTRYDEGGTDEGNTTTVTYGSGMITGENFLDTVGVAGLVAQKSNVVSLTSAMGFSDPNAPALLGMGFSTIAQSEQPTYFENLIAQKKVKRPEFSFFLGRASSGTTAYSELTLGGRDPSRFIKPITKVPVTQRGYWQVALDGVLVNKAVGLGLTKGQAAIDTGTTIVLAPTVASIDIYSRIPGARLVSVSGGVLMYTYPCSETPEVEIVFAGRPFAIAAEDFSLGKLTSNFGMFMVCL
jgi:hypothetical protein